jgi:hypothetical protein
MNRYRYMRRAVKEELEQWSNVVARRCRVNNQSRSSPHDHRGNNQKST